MGDYAIQAGFTAACQPAELMRWLTTPEGIAGWWSDTVSGSASSAGDSFSVRFPTTDMIFQLDVDEVSEETVTWHVPQSPPWWKGTSISFAVTAGDDGGSSILFTHDGFDGDDPAIPVITPAWVRFLDNLVSVAESGEPSPAVVN